MTKENAIKAANIFLSKRNPTLWNGTGIRPKEFSFEKMEITDPETKYLMRINYEYIIEENKIPVNKYKVVVSLFNPRREFVVSYICDQPESVGMIAECLQRASAGIKEEDNVCNV